MFKKMLDIEKKKYIEKNHYPSNEISKWRLMEIQKIEKINLILSKNSK